MEKAIYFVFIILFSFTNAHATVTKQSCKLNTYFSVAISREYFPNKVFAKVEYDFDFFYGYKIGEKYDEIELELTTQNYHENIFKSHFTKDIFSVIGMRSLKSVTVEYYMELNGETKKISTETLLPLRYNPSESKIIGDLVCFEIAD